MAAGPATSVAGARVVDAAQGVVNDLFAQGTPQVALKFTSVIGSSEIDDVFVDPHEMR
ncbi:MAG: hypothetical protein JO325_02940 [Solirubrobacterales bacterium]|nr:hypothetical protein [Solirubrobacterales bacterium]